MRDSTNTLNKINQSQNIGRDRDDDDDNNDDAMKQLMQKSIHRIARAASRMSISL
jgi:hypothetical protein